MSWHNAGRSVKSLLLRIAGDRYKDLVLFALSWDRVVGSTLAERSFIERFHNHILYVGVTNSIWLQELYLNKHMILDRLNREHNNKINDIVFFIKSE